jgi:hypothetical protein
MAGHEAASRAPRPSNTVLLGLPALAAMRRDPDAREVVGESLWRPDAKSDVGKDAGRRRAAPEPPRLMNEHADALIARPGQAEPVGLAPDPAAGLGDRVRLAVEANDRLEQAGRDARSDGRHASQLLPLEARESVMTPCRWCQVTLCYKALEAPRNRAASTISLEPFHASAWAMPHPRARSRSSPRRSTR